MIYIFHINFTAIVLLHQMRILMYNHDITVLIQGVCFFSSICLVPKKRYGFFINGPDKIDIDAHFHNASNLSILRGQFILKIKNLMQISGKGDILELDKKL